MTKLFFYITAQSDDRKKRPRTAFSAAQIKALETEFERGKYLSVAKRTALAKQLHLTETQVSILLTFEFFIFGQSVNKLLLPHYIYSNGSYWYWQRKKNRQNF